MPDKDEKALNTWKAYRTEPIYPQNNLAYTILSGEPPEEDPERDGLFRVKTEEGKTLLVWRSTFLALCEIMDKNLYKNTSVVFNRAENSKVTTVRKA